MRADRRTRCLAIGIAVALAACSSSGDADGPNPTDSATPSSGSAPPTAVAESTPTTTAATSSTPPTSPATDPPVDAQATRVALGARWSEGDVRSFEQRLQGVGVPQLVAFDSEVWLFAREHNAALTLRSLDAGATWNEVVLTAPSPDARLVATGVARGASGRLIVTASRSSRCTERLDLGGGLTEVGLCGRTQAVLFLSDDDGQTWREVGPAAMAPPGDVSVELNGLIATGDGFLAAGTVRGPDWHVRLWSSADGETWALDREVRGTSPFVTADQLLTDGSTVVLLLSEHPCGVPADTPSGWVLGTTWAKVPAVYTGASAADLVPVASSALPLVRDLDPALVSDCALLQRDFDPIDVITELYPPSSGTVIDGVVTLFEEPRATDADRAAEEADDDEAASTSGVRRLAQLVDGEWTSIEIDGVASAGSIDGSQLVDLDGVPGIVEWRFDGTGRTEVIAIAPGAAGTWAAVAPEHPVVADFLAAATAVDGELLVAGSVALDPFAASGADNPRLLTVWTSSTEPAPPCELGPGVRCRFAQLSESPGYPDFAGVDLSGADLAFARVGDADLSGADFSGATLWGIFSDPDATFDAANFTGAQLQGAYLRSTASADFTGANLTNTSVLRADGAVLTGAMLSGATLEVEAVPDFTGVDTRGLRLSFTAPSSGPYEVSLAGLDLTEMWIEGEFDGPQLVVVSLDGAVIDDTDFYSVDLRAIPPTVDLSLADVWDNSICPDGLPPDGAPIGTCQRAPVG